MSLQESFDRYGISGRLREEVLRPFFRLVFGDEDLRTSYQFAMLSMQDLLSGMPSLPALGMQALPNQLALGLEKPVEHGVDVMGVVRSAGEGVRILTDGGEIHARAAVVATDPVTASSLLGLGTPTMRGVATWWFSTEVPPTTLKTPFVNPIGPSAGPLSHVVVVSNVAPRYAPHGQAPRRGLLGGGDRAERGHGDRGGRACAARSDLPHRRGWLGTGHPARQVGCVAGRATTSHHGPRGRPR